MANAISLALNRALYALARPLIFRVSAQQAHTQTMELLRWIDGQDWAQAVLHQSHRLAFDEQPVAVGGVTLPYPLILAAGFIKGDGFDDETSALAAVEGGRNIIPGWRSMPALVGPVEFGSFTRWPRLGNPGTVLWRDVSTRSTQNRVGLKNPGARAAAAFLDLHCDQLPAVFGINLAASPGVTDPAQEQAEILEAIGFFLERHIQPTWFTLNISCPNTEDDPGARQTATKTRALCQALIDQTDIPLWVKISPDLTDEQYTILMKVFQTVGVQAVIATNTLAQPAPDDTTRLAGVGGGRLHDCAVAATIRLQSETVAMIGCGGILDGATFRDFRSAVAGQYWSALIYRGPLAAALILNEVAHA
jgi:dihydroorotate dehydrogenase